MYFKGKRVLVTGGTGTFGQVAVRRLLKEGAREIRVFSRDETKQREMERVLPDERITYTLGNIREIDSLRWALRGIDVVFHAAALKHVPRCEYNVRETIRTNVFGSANVIRAAREARVGTLVALGSDKAVRPINTYGMTKALMERLVISANADLKGYPTRCVCVRYGNVIGSRGSVVPFFREQIAEGGPVTITDARMTRFWFTIDQAVGIAFDAAVLGIGGEVFVPKMSAANLLDLAKVLIGDRDIEIESIGARPGEKIHELLISEEEAGRTVRQYQGGYVILPALPTPGIKEFYGEPQGIDGARSSEDILMSREELSTLLDRAGWLK